MAARFRKIDPRIWTDEKFRQLKAEEQRIALYILTAQSNRIGLFSFSAGKAREDLDMSPQTFRKGFQKVCQTLNWEWDADARVLYLPTWWRYNQPENGNNVIGNLKDLDDLPKTPHGIVPVVTVVEGEIDKLSLAVAGTWACVSVPDGAPPVGSKDLAIKLDYLEKSQDLLDKIPQFVLAVDNDEPGEALEQELIRRLGPDRCARVVWPEGCKDANEVLLKYGVETLREMIQNAKPVPLRGVMRLEEFEEEVRALYHHGMEKGLSTGWANVDTIYTIRPGHLTVVTGIPSHGKSTWVDALCVELANHHDWRIGMFSPENYPYYLHAKNLIEKVWQKPFEQLTAEEMEQGLVWGNERFFWIGMEEEFTLEKLLAQAKGLVRRFGIRGLVLDPWNEIEHLRTERWSETEYISSCMSQLRNFARIHQVHVWLVAHPTKLYRTKDGKYPIPGPYDISGSAHFRNKTDWCLTIWRGLDYAKSREVQVHCQKARFREFGQIGMQILEWLPERGGIYRPSVAVDGEITTDDL